MRSGGSKGAASDTLWSSLAINRIKDGARSCATLESHLSPLPAAHWTPATRSGAAHFHLFFFYFFIFFYFLDFILNFPLFIFSPARLWWPQRLVRLGASMRYRVLWRLISALPAIYVSIHRSFYTFLSLEAFFIDFFIFLNITLLRCGLYLGVAAGGRG